MIVEVDGGGVEVLEIDFVGGLSGFGNSQVRFLEIAGGGGFGVESALDVGELGCRGRWNLFLIGEFEAPGKEILGVEGDGGSVGERG